MIGLGCMRLSTETTRDDAQSLEILRAAIADGITLFDTADAYALDDLDIGHNEALIARARAEVTQSGDRIDAPPARIDATPAPHRIEVVTKGGLVRPEGAWVPKGSARHLDAAARASRGRLGAIDTYLLHVVDPRVPLATSVRALAKLRDEGIVRAIGLSNVTQHQLEQALELAPIAAIEIELSPYKLDALHAGLVAFCAQRGIRVLAYRPLGGRTGVKRIARDARLRELIVKDQSEHMFFRGNFQPGNSVGLHFPATATPTPHEMVLAWLAAKGVVPIPGVTRLETLQSVARANRLRLSEELVRLLDEHFLDETSETSETSATTGGPTRGADVILVMGMPGAGKTSLAKEIEAQGYVRLNRDERGGTLAELARELGRELAGGAKRVVLDNTYGSRASRALVIRAAKKHGARVTCRVLVTSIEQAQNNAVSRMLEEHGRLLEPAEMQGAKAIGPGAQFRYRKSYEPPRVDEGFASVDEVLFERKKRGGGKRALIVELDSIVWRARPTSAAGVVLVDGVREQLARWRGAGWLLAGTTWQTPPEADARLRDLLGLPIEILRCVHPAGPPVCWCRKPMPGLALAFARAHDVDLAASVHVGHGPADKGFALRAGIDYFDVADGWPDEPFA